MKRLFRFLIPYKKQISLMLILIFLQIFGTLYIPTLTADIVNNGIMAGDIDYIWRTGSIMIFIAVLVVLFSISSTYLSAFNAASLARDIRSALFRKVQLISTEKFNEIGTASMITRNTNDVLQIQQAFSSLVQMLLPAPVMAVAGLTLAFSKDRFLALSITGVMLLIILLAIIISKRAIPLFGKLQDLMDNINRKVRETIIGIRIIRAFSRSDDEKKRIDDSFLEYGKLAIRINKIFAVMLPGITLIMNLCTLFLVWLGGNRMAAGMMQVGDLMAMIEYAAIILIGLIMGIMAFVVIPKANASAARINAVLDIETEANELLSVHDQVYDHPSDKACNKAKVEFHNVSFRYNSAEDPVLRNISFTTDKGKTTAIIGSTGSGKSTIVSLLMGFNDIKEGNIFIDGEDIQDMPKSELRGKIGYVPQKSFLFSGTIADNLRHGKSDATPNEMLHAAQIAQIDDFINGLEDGMEASVSQGGNNYSGGQKQRLSIARAILKKPEIIIFDDSFSALDFKTDAKLRAALKKELSKSAIVVVAQRISSIIDADQIIVLDKGQIVGMGTHMDLMTNCPVYQQIAKSQLSMEEVI